MDAIRTDMQPAISLATGDDAQFRFLAENATDMLSRHTADGIFLYASPASVRLFGYTPEEMVDRSAYEFIHPDDITYLLARHGKVLEEPNTVDARYRYRFRCSDGSYVNAETTARLVKDAAGQVTEIHAVTRDISERIAKEQFRVAFDAAPTGMALVGAREQERGRFLRVNETLCQMLGYEAEELEKMTFAEITHPDDRAPDDEGVRRLLAGEIDRHERDKRYLRADDQEIWVQLSSRLLRDSDGNPLHFIAQIWDITERRRLETRIKVRDQRYQALASAVPVGLYEADTDFHCQFVNDRWCELSGMSREEAVGLGWAETLHPDDYDRVGEAWLKMAERGGEFNLEYRYLQPNGRVVWVAGRAVAVRDADGHPASFLGTVTDITEHRLVEERLTRLANEDDLTGLANRRCFSDELQRHIDHCARYGWRGALLILDLDRFKSINDTLGHSAGDQLMKQVAGRLRQRLRTSDFAGRIGGDEFAVLLPEAHDGEAETTAEAILDTFSAQETTIGDSHAATTSIGLAVISDEVTAEELMIRADIALYEAKGRGGNALAVYDEDLDERFADPSAPAAK
jgi:diguanylate cyclase (GGDEF)-like protein/PAS domain S-box-containing protein